MYAVAHMWLLGDNFVKLILSFLLYVGSKDQAPAKCFYTPRHLTVSLVLSFVDFLGISHKCSLST